MGVASVKKLELYAHNTVVDAVLTELQRLGCCEVFLPECDGDVQETLPLLADLDEKISEARYLLRMLEPHYADQVSSMARSFGEKPEYSLREMADIAGSFDVRGRAEDVRRIERGLVEIRSEISQNDGYLSLLSGLKEMPYPLGLLASGTDMIFGILGTMPVEQIDYWKKSLDDSFGEDLEVYVSPFGEKDREAFVVVVGLRDLESKVLQMSSSSNLTKIDVSRELSLSVPEEIAEIKDKRQTLLDRSIELEGNLRAYASQIVPDARLLGDYWTVLADRARATGTAEKTDQVVLIRSWVPSEEAAKLEKLLKPFEKLVEVSFSDPQESDVPPTVLKNPEWSVPFEILTTLYGAPSYGGVDPTPLLAPFFFVFFGMCLGDGGYGLLMVGFFMFFLKKFKKMPSGIKQFFNLFVLSGIAATLVGALTGSWMGDMIDVVPFLGFLKPLKDIPVLLIPMNDPMAFLGISLAFGVFQIFFGMAVAMKECLKKKDYMGAFADQLGWMVFLMGLLLLGASSKIPSISGLAKFVAAVGALSLIATQGRAKDGVFQKAISGVLSLYNVTSYLGDVLSYSRLLALGLATSAIGMIINMLAGLSSGIPYVGWLIALILFFGGHLFSVAVNILGAFVHALRLQYVEFFSKFYSGGGRLFDPLRYKTKYVVVSEDGVKG